MAIFQKSVIQKHLVALDKEQLESVCGLSFYTKISNKNNANKVA